MRSVKKILVDSTGKKYYVKDLGVDFHTTHGIIKKQDLKKSSIRSSKGKFFTVLEPNLADLHTSLDRGPQVITAKDIGLILARTSVNGNSIIVDAGAGSGSLSLALANICKKVTAYEINPEHFRIASKNLQQSGLKNLTLVQENIYDGIQEKNLDLITLDLPEPWRVVVHAEKSLKIGGFLVVYLPNLHQVKMFLDTLGGTSIKLIDTTEILERKWKIDSKIMRPEFQMLGHTGFLTFCRRLA
jgi:tRNA (adenine57-N1/adenine58-N1)-methyltransferase catalytic subunit